MSAHTTAQRAGHSHERNPMPDHKTTLRLQCTNQLSSDRFEILFIQAGEANGYSFSQQVLEDSLRLWESCSVFVDHSFWGRSVRDLGGVLEHVAWSDEHQGLTATLIASGPSRDIVIEAARTMLTPGPHPDFGFSADLYFKCDDSGNVTRIMEPMSVDLVIDPAFATKFIRQLNQHDGARSAGKESSMSPHEEGKTTPLAGTQPELPDMQAYAVAATQQLLSGALAVCDLPASAQDAIRTQFKDKAAQPHEITEAIAAWQKALADIQAPAQIHGPARVSGMFDSRDQLQAAVDDLVGAPREHGAEKLQVAKFAGIKEAYLALSGDRDFIGGFFPDRIQFTHTTASFPALVANALNKALAREWEQLGRAGYDWWQKIATIEHFDVLNDITWLLFGTVASLPTVAEGDPYTELTIGDGKETSSFVKKGGYIGLTLEALDRDDTRKLRAIPRELANAGLREISALVAGIFTANAGAGPTMADTGALFNATVVTTAGGHKNLLTTALGADYTAWDAVSQAVYDQPMLVTSDDGSAAFGTGKKAAVEPRYCLVPRALKAQAEALFIPRWAATVEAAIASKGGPSYGGYVEPITVPEWTDANDWAAAVDPAIMPGVMIGERFGLLPQIFVAGSETDGAMFTNDESRIKVRHFIAVGVADYRPLHKSNVA